MPRRNNPKKQPVVHGPSMHDPDFKPGCYGCAFACRGFKCMTSDGQCLKSALNRKEVDNAGTKR